MNKVYTEYPDAPDIDSSTADYAKRFSGSVGKWFLDVQSNGTSRLLSLTHTPSPVSVLDVGGGHGQNIPVLKDIGANITVQGSVSECSALIQHYIDAGELSFVCAPMKRLPFEDNSFDVVLCYRQLAHVADWPDLVDELVRVSRDLVIVDFATKRSLNAVADMFFGLKKSVERNTRPFRLQSFTEVSEAFDQSGAGVVGCMPQYFFPMALHRALKHVAISRRLEEVAGWLGLRKALGSPVLAAYKKR